MPELPVVSGKEAIRAFERLGYAPKVGFESELRSLNPNYKGLLESVFGRTECFGGYECRI